MSHGPLEPLGGAFPDTAGLWPQQQTDLAPQQDPLAASTWGLRPAQSDPALQGQLTGMRMSSDAEGTGLSVGDPLASATLLIRPGGAPPSAVLAAQGQPAGMLPAEAAAMLQAQRRTVLQLRQQLVAAAVQQQQLMQAQQQGPCAGLDAQELPSQQQPEAQPQLLQTPSQPQSQSQPQSMAAVQQGVQAPQQLPSKQDALMGPVLEVDADLLEKEGDRVVSALSGGQAERAWALNALCLLSYRQDLRLSSTPGLLAALLPVMQEGLAAAVGLSSDDWSGGGSSLTGEIDEQRQQQGLPPLPGWQCRRAEHACRGLFLDHERLDERLQEAAAAAVVLRNVAEVQQNAALLLDPPVMRCWTWSLDAARELVQQQVGSSSGSLVVAGGGTAADICTTLLQMISVLSGRMLLPAFFECGMLLLRSLLILLRPSWQYSAAAAGGAVLPPPLVSLATLAVTAVATAYQPNTEILLSMTCAPGSGQPGATLMQVIADLLVCPFEVFRQHAQQQVDEETPGWRLLLPTDAELLAEAKRSSRAGSRMAAGAGSSSDPSLAARTAQDRSTAELCTLDMMAVLSQLRYLSALLHLLWRLLAATGPAGAHARTAVAGCPRLLYTLCEIAMHRWPQHPVRWHADGHTLRHPDAYPAYLRFLSHDMMPAMRERQELLQPLRADAAALLALLAADPETRQSVVWCEGQLVTAVMQGVVPPAEPGISALLARFAAQDGGSSGGIGSKEPGMAPASDQPTTQTTLMAQGVSIPQ